MTETKETPAPAVDEPKTEEEKVVEKDAETAAPAAVEEDKGKNLAVSNPTTATKLTSHPKQRPRAP